MPTKKKYNARFPPARIKKIMQTDEDIGKVAAPVPVILSKALEIFMQSLLETACKNTQARHAKTMSTAHLKQCITTESQFDFLKELVETIPDLPANGEDVDEDEDQPKPKRKKTSSSTATQKEKVPRKPRKKKEKEAYSESDEDSLSEEEDGSNSTGSGNNTGAISFNTHSETSNSNPVPSFSNSAPMVPNSNTVSSKNFPLPSSSSSSSSSTVTTSLQIPKNSIPSLYRPVHSEDDDYDS